MCNFSEKTILVEIPAYIDNQLIPTVESALLQADNANRIHFAICYQNDNLDDYVKLKNIKNISIIQISAKKARGACYARHLCQTLLKDEDYVLHTDSHMRFCKHWDTELIKELESFNDRKAVLSAYPQNGNEEIFKMPPHKLIFDEPIDGSVHYCKSFLEDGKNVVFGSRDFTEYDENPKRNIWTAGGFLFAHRDFDVEVPFDPHMYHLQDELSVSLRAFTHGYNIYNPRKHYIVHWYNRGGQNIPDGCLNYDEIARLRKLFRIEDNHHDLTGYDIGTERTIEEFEKCSGLYYKERCILKHSTAGFYFNDEMIEKMGNTMPLFLLNEYEDYKIQSTECINVFVVGRSPDEVKICINTALQNAHDKHLLNFVAILPERHKDNQAMKEIRTIYVKNDAKYGGYINAIDFSQYDNDAFCLIVDSDVRFTKHTRRVCWDEYYKLKLLSFGRKAVLGGCIRQDTNGIATAVFNMTCKVTGRNQTKILYENNCKLINRDSVEPMLRDGFIFAKAGIFKEVKPDPDLLFSEFMSTYSARLYTYGYDIYYPSIMYFYRLSNVDFLDKIGNTEYNYSVVGYIFNGRFPQSLLIPNNYEYGIGSERRIKRWLEMIDFNFSNATFLNSEN